MTIGRVNLEHPIVRCYADAQLTCVVCMSFISWWIVLWDLDMIISIGFHKKNSILFLTSAAFVIVSLVTPRRLQQPQMTTLQTKTVGALCTPVCGQMHTLPLKCYIFEATTNQAGDK